MKKCINLSIGKTTIKNRSHLSQLYQSLTGKTTHTRKYYPERMAGYQVPRCDEIRTFEEV